MSSPFEFEDTVVDSVRRLMYHIAGAFNPESDEHSLFVSAGDALAEVLDYWSEDQ